jgi:CBS domain-containing protein
MQVKTVMKSPPTIVTPGTPLAEVAARVAVDATRCALVVHEQRLVGIVTDADVRHAGPSTIRRLAEHDLRSGLRALRVADAMRPADAVVGPGTPLPAAARLMRERRVRALAVVEDAEPVGVLTASILLPVVLGALDAGRRRGVERVLVVVDDEHDRSLVETGVRLAPGGVEVVHVLPALVRLGHATLIPAWARAEVAAIRHRTAEAWLARLMARVPGAPDAGRVLHGEAVETLARLARASMADLIVVRRGGPRVAPLMRTSPCPVLAV